MLTAYTYAHCSTCRNAMRWLKERGLAVQERPIRETPPTLAELRAMLQVYGGQVKRLCNTSGLDYRAQKLGETLSDRTEAEALALLAANGNLVKRPFLLGPGLALVGFHEKTWANALAAAGIKAAQGV